MTLAFADEDTAIPVTPDAGPEVSDVEYPCAVCGREIDVPYGGRGRRPTRCSEHRKVQTKRAAGVPRVTGNNATLAAQATEALCSIDGMTALGASVIGFTKTAETIMDADETFRIRVNSALLNSPDTARKILRFAGKAGDASLFIAIMLHVATIAPVFAAEAKERKAEKEAARLLAEQEQ